MLVYNELRRLIETYLTKEECDQVHTAFIVAEKAHREQKRLSGEPYVTHPIEVAKILAEFHLDLETLQAGLLHDILEDTKITKEELIGLFGNKVAQLVDGVSKLKQIEFSSRAHEQAENLCRRALCRTTARHDTSLA